MNLPRRIHYLRELVILTAIQIEMQETAEAKYKNLIFSLLILLFFVLHLIFSTGIFSLYFRTRKLSGI